MRSNFPKDLEKALEKIGFKATGIEGQYAHGDSTYVYCLGGGKVSYQISKSNDGFDALLNDVTEAIKALIQARVIIELYFDK